MNNWKLIKAEKFIDFNPRESIQNGVLAKKVAMEQLKPFTRDISTYEIAPFNGGSKFRNGDTLMARITPCLENGKTAQVNILEDGEVGFGSTEFTVMRAKPDLSDKDFIYYWATSPFLREIAIKSMSGSSGRQRVQQSVLNNIEFLVPPLEEQIKIGHTLRVLDDKIANNIKINHHLEQMIRAVFHHLFVENDEVDGWKVGKLGDVAKNIRRGANVGSIDPGSSYIGLEHMPRGSIALSEWGQANELVSKKFIFKQGEFLFGKLRPYFHKVGIAPVDGVCSTDILVIVPKSAEWYGFILGHISSVELINYTNAASTGTKMPRTNWSDIESYEVAIPPVKFAKEFNEIILPMIQSIRANILESRNLANLRDSLLPKLVSGELSVTDVDAK